MKNFTFNDSGGSQTSQTNRWFERLMICVMFVFGQIVFGQMGTIQVGSGAGTAVGSTAIPVSNYVYNYSQQIITASEYSIGGGAPGEITKLRYKPTNVGTITVWNSWTVYIGNTDKTEFISDTDWVLLPDLTQVFTGIIPTPTANDWFEIEFTVPFDYTGGNIVVAVHENTLGWNTAPTFSAYTSTSNSGIMFRSDSDNPSPASPPTAYQRVSLLAQIQFEGILSSCPPPLGLSATAITTNSAELFWDSTGTTFDIEYGITGFTPSGVPTIADVPNNYVVNGLNSSTTYQYYARQNCGEDGESAWMGPFSFTTECDLFSVPFQEQFSGGVLPNCWTNTSSNPVANGLWKFAGTPDYGALTNGKPVGTYAWVDGSDPNDMNNVTLTSPLIDVSSLTVPFISFEYFSYNNNTYPNNVFTVQINDGTTWTTVFSDNTNDTQWREIDIPLTEFSGTTLQVRFVVDKTIAPAGWAFYNDILLDNIKVMEAPVCIHPSSNSLAVSNINAESADLSWESEGTAFDIKWGETGFDLETEGTLISGVANPYNLSGLTQSTSYQYYVRQDCGVDGVSIWSGPFGFMTTQIPVALDYQEDFEGVHNWILSNDTQTNKWVVGETTNNGGTHSMYISNDNGVSNNYSHVTSTVHAYRDIQVPADAESVLLSFDWKSGGESTWDYFRVWVVPSFFTPASGTQITTANSGGVQFGGYYNLQTNWTNQWFEIPSMDYAGQIVRLVFEWRNDGGGGNQIGAAIDNINISVVTCPTPSELTVSNVTNNSAELSWQSTGSSFDIEYGVTGFTPSGIPTLTDVSNNFVLDTLNSATTYQYYVRQNCGVDGESAWAGPFSFTTECDVFGLPFQEQFSTGILPNCWANTSSNMVPNGLWKFAGAPDYGATTNGKPVGTYAWVDGSDPSNIDDITLTSPPIDVSSLTVPFISFEYFSNNTNIYANNVFTVQVSDGTTWTTVFTDNTNDPQWREIDIPLTEFSGTSLQVRFIVDKTVAPSGNAFYNDILLDNVKVMEAPVCIHPISSGLSANNITFTTADLSWISEGTLFDVEWGVENFVLGEGTIITGITTNEVSLTDLTAETSYQFYVRQDCGVDGVSLWTGPYTFYTGYCEVTSTSTTNGIGNFTTIGGIMNINNSSGGGSYSNYSTQAVAQFIGGEDVQFVITSATGTNGMGVWIDWNNDMDFNDPGEHVYNSGAYVTTGTGTISIPAGTPVGNYRMRVVANWLNTSPVPCGDLGNGLYGEAEDYTFTVIDPPTCMPPTGLTVISVTADSANLSWQSEGTLFDIKWGLTGFDLETEGTLISGAGNPYTLSGLTQSTSYQYYVRQDCGEDDGVSLWAGPFGFMTTQIPVTLDYEEDFEGVHNWILSNGTQTNKWVVGEITNNGGTHSMYISNDNGVSNNYSHTTSTVHAYRDIQVPADAESVLLSFDWKSGGESTWDYFRVWVVPASFTPTTGTQITTANSGGVQFGGYYNLQTNWTNQWFEIPTMDYAGQIVRLVFEWRNDGGGGNQIGAAIDNVSISVVTCPAPSGLVAGSLTLNSADISWVSSGDAFNIEYGVAGFALGTGTTETASTTSLSLTGLTAHTTYEFYVQQDCGASGLSAWTGPHSFHTGHCVPSSTNSGDHISSFVTTDGIPFNISNTNSGASSGGYGNFGSMSVSHYETGSVGFTVTAGGDPMGVNIWIDWNNNLEFEESEKVYASGATGASFTGTITVPFGVPTGDYRMRVRGQWNNANPEPCGLIAWGEAEDYTFTVIDPPSCLPPFTPTAINASATSVSLAWQSNGEIFDIEYGPAGFTPGTGTTIPGVGNPYVLSGLTPGVDYAYYVRQDCGEEDGYSMWNGPVSFTPGIFQGNIPTLLNANPQVGDIACATSFSIDVPEGYFLSALSVEYVMISIDPAWTSQQRSVLYSPTLEMGEDAVVAGNADNYPGMVSYNREITFANGATGTIEFALKAWRTSGGTGCGTTHSYVIDGSWVLHPEFELIPSCPNPPADLGYTNITETSVDLTWTAEPGTFQVQWGDVGFNPTDELGTIISDLTSNTHAIDGLDSSIPYEFYVRRDCSTDDAEDFGAWVGPFRFNSGYCLPSSPQAYYFSQFNTTGALENIVFSYPGPNLGVGYKNNTDMIVTQDAGLSFDFASNYVGGASGLRIWVDWNNNFLFEDEEEVFYLGSGSSNKTGTIAIPADAVNGDYRMRVRAQQGTTSIPPACGSINTGEALDFTLRVQGGVHTPDFASFGFAFYPNPVGEMLYLRANTEISQVVVFNMLGQQLNLPVQSENTQIDMTGLPAGNYVLSVTIEGMNKTFKVVKK